MTLLRSRSLLTFVLTTAALALPACSGTPTPGGDASDVQTDGARNDVVSDVVTADAADATTTPDASDVVTADTADATTPADVVTTDAVTTDTVTTDTVTTDAVTTDTVSTDSSSADAAPTCEYFESPIYLLRCGDAWQQVFEWLATGGATPACPTYYTADTRRADSVEALASDLGCPTACIYRSSTAVMFLDCGRRNEYISYTAATSGCASPMLQFSDGSVYSSLEAYRADHPCP